MEPTRYSKECLWPKPVTPVEPRRCWHHKQSVRCSISGSKQLHNVSPRGLTPRKLTYSQITKHRRNQPWSCTFRCSLLSLARRACLCRRLHDQYHTRRGTRHRNQWCTSGTPHYPMVVQVALGPDVAREMAYSTVTSRTTWRDRSRRRRLVQRRRRRQHRAIHR